VTVAHFNTAIKAKVAVSRLPYQAIDVSLPPFQTKQQIKTSKYDFDFVL